MIVALLAASIIPLIFLFSYNGLKQHQHDVRVVWSQMDEQLKRRYTMLPQLMDKMRIGEGNMTAELQRVSAAKNRAAIAVSPAALAAAEHDLSQAIRHVITTAGRDSVFKEDKAFLELYDKLVASDQGIVLAQQRYNEQVYAINAAISHFPGLYVAKMIGLRYQPYFGSGTEQ